MTDHPEGPRCFCDHGAPGGERTEVRVQSRLSPSIIEGARRLAGRVGDADGAASWVEFVFERGGYTRQLRCEACGRSERLTVDEIQALASWADANGVPHLLLRHVPRVVELLRKESPGNMAE